MYGEICKLPIMSSKAIHHPTLKTLKIKNGVLMLIYGISWATDFEVDVPTYVELVREYYTTFQF